VACGRAAGGEVGGLPPWGEPSGASTGVQELAGPQGPRQPEGGQPPGDDPGKYGSAS
jgi:hypothetical protein